MRFKIDENLPPEVADLLRQHGHDALTVWDQGLRGKPDSELAGVLRLERRSFVTLDLGFADIRSYPPNEYSGLIVLRLSKQDRTHVLRTLPHVVSLFASEPVEGRLWIVDEESVRIRAGGKET